MSEQPINIIHESDDFSVRIVHDDLCIIKSYERDYHPICRSYNLKNGEVELTFDELKELVEILNPIVEWYEGLGEQV